MKEIGKMKERHEFSFDGRQLGLVLLAAVFLAALMFALGVTVGRQWETRKLADNTAATRPSPPPVVPTAPPAAPPSAPPVAPFTARTTAAPAPDVPKAEKPGKAPVKAPDHNLTFPKVLASKTNKTAPLVPGNKMKDKAGAYTVQVGAYNEKKAAQSRADRLRKKGYEARVYTARDKKDKYAFKVRIGRFGSRDEAADTARKVGSSEKLTPYITVEE